MPWYWTDHLAAILNTNRPNDIAQSSTWINHPIAVRVDLNANPLVVAEELLAEDEEADDPECTNRELAA